MVGAHLVDENGIVSYHIFFQSNPIKPGESSFTHIVNLKTHIVNLKNTSIGKVENHMTMVGPY